MKFSTIICLVILATSAWVMGGCKTEYVHVGANWDALHKLEPENNGFKVKVYGTSEAALNETLSFDVTSEKAGKLWIIQVDANDEVTMMFPNQAMPDNAIPAGQTVTIPPKDDSWEIAAGEPVGKSMVAFVVTTGNADIGDILTQGKDVSKALYLIQKSEWGIYKKVIDIH